MSETTKTQSRGDRLLAGLGGANSTASSFSKPTATADETFVPDDALLAEVTAKMPLREMETQRLREAMLEAGVSEEVLTAPEQVETDHLSEDEQTQFNDAVREHRGFQQALQHDLQELQRSRDALGIRYEELGMPPADEAAREEAS